jgi:hypothetical protein
MMQPTEDDVGRVRAPAVEMLDPKSEGFYASELLTAESTSPGTRDESSDNAEVDCEAIGVVGVVSDGMAQKRTREPC